MRGSGFSCCCACLTKGSWQHLRPRSVAFSAGRQEHGLPAHRTLSPRAAREVGLKLQKSWASAKSQILYVSQEGGRKRSPPARRREEQRPRVSLISRANTARGLEPRRAERMGMQDGRGAEPWGLALAPHVPPAGPVGHYSLRTFIIRLPGREESGRNSGLNGSLKRKCLNKASSSPVPFQRSRVGKTGKQGFKAGNLEVSTSGLICPSRRGRMRWMFISPFEEAVPKSAFGYPNQKKGKVSSSVGQC